MPPQEPVGDIRETLSRFKKFMVLSCSLRSSTAALVQVCNLKCKPFLYHVSIFNNFSSVFGTTLLSFTLLLSKLWMHTRNNFEELTFLSFPLQLAEKRNNRFAVVTGDSLMMRIEQACMLTLYYSKQQSLWLSAYISISDSISFLPEPDSMTGIFPLRQQ